MAEHRIPGELKAAARLGAAKELDQVVILVRDVKARTRSLYLAEHVGLRKCEERWMDSWDRIRDKQQAQFSYTGRDFVWADNQYDHWKQNGQDGAGIGSVRRGKRERVFRVIEHLGTMPEGVRSMVLLEAEGLGVPILDWPGERLPYRVEFPDE